MSDWYRIAFTRPRVCEFSDTLQKIHDAQRQANWSAEARVLVTNDWIHLEGVPSMVVYFPPSAAEIFSSLIAECDGSACLEPLPFGLEVHGS